MKTGLLFLALGLSAVLVQGTSSSGWGAKSGYSSTYSYEEYSRLEYSFKVSKALPTTGKCGQRGFFDCDSGCGEPVCKCAHDLCGSTVCKATEVCHKGACYEYVCKNGLEVISIEEEKCEKVCKKEIEEECETVKVCAGKGRRLKSFGFDIEKSSSLSIKDKGHGKGYGHISHGSTEDVTIEKITNGQGYGHGYSEGHGVEETIYEHDDDDTEYSEVVIEEPYPKGCHYVDEVQCVDVPKTVCDDVCKPTETVFVTEEKCGYEEELVACGSGYCKPGDLCYAPTCDKECFYKTKQSCW